MSSAKCHMLSNTIQDSKACCNILGCQSCLLKVLQKDFIVVTQSANMLTMLDVNRNLHHINLLLYIPGTRTAILTGCRCNPSLVS